MQRWAAIAVLCLTASRAAATPPRYPRPAPPSASPVMAAAEAAWKAATDEPDLEAATGKWRLAARAFDAVAADEGQARAIRSEAAYAALLAWKNALAIDPRVKSATTDDDAADPDRPPPPRPIAPDDQALLDALDRYLALDPADAEIPGVKFVRANLLRRYHHDDEAEVALADLLDHHRQHEVGEYAANLLLDLLIIHHRYDELIARERELRADAAFMRAHPDLAARLLDIEVRGRRLAAEAAEREARRTDDGAQYARCAAIYDELLELAPTDRDRDEARYNAAVCVEASGDVDGALARYGSIASATARTPLASHALGRRARLLATTGRFVEAALELETYAVRYPTEPEARAALLDAIAYQARAGDGDHATHAALRFVKLYGARRPGEAAEMMAGLAAIRLGRGDRKAAAADVRRLLKLPAVRLEAEPVGLLIWNAACPFARADRLCLRHDTPQRDRALALAAQAHLARTHSSATALAEADATLETALGGHAGDDARLERARGVYETLVRADWADPDSVALAHARLGFLAERALHPAEARAAYQACAAIARPSLIAVCDDGLARTGGVPPTAERRPHAAIAAPPFAAEPAVARDPTAAP